METGAVITADIVNYTGLSRADQLKLIDRVTQLAKEYMLEFYRGDSFQIYLKQPIDALKLLLQLRTAAKAIDQSSMTPMADIRASIGIGEVETPLTSLSTATGEAFILSGRSFDSMIKSEQKLIIQSGQISIATALKLIASFVDYLLNHLTSKQAEVVFELLNDQTQTETAKKLKKSQATVNQHLQSAAWTEIEKLLDEYVQLTSQFQ